MSSSTAAGRSTVPGLGVAKPPPPHVAVGFLLATGLRVPVYRQVAEVRLIAIGGDVASAEAVHCRVVDGATHPAAARSLLEREILRGPDGRREPPLVLCAEVRGPLAALALRARAFVFPERVEDDSSIDIVAYEATRLAREYVRSDPDAVLPWASGALGGWIGDGLKPITLTERQRTVLALAALGRRRGEIARLLGSQLKRVDIHIGEILARTGELGLDDVAAPFARAIEMGQWEDPEVTHARRTPGNGMPIP